MESKQQPGVDPPRRTFLKRFVAVLLAPLIGLIPTVPGLWVLFSTARRRDNAGGPPFLEVTTLDAVPADSVPRLFRVVVERHRDAWTTRRNVPVGAVYLVRHEQEPDKIIAFNTVCPHLGCFVNKVADNSFHCPCHDSRFKPDGSRGEPCVAARGLDELATRIEHGNVLVQFQNFQTSIEEKHPV